ncbi:hypothetical protein NQ318_009524, partial [Aromia moschata]
NQSTQLFTAPLEADIFEPVALYSEKPQFGLLSSRVLESLTQTIMANRLNSNSREGQKIISLNLKQMHDLQNGKWTEFKNYLQEAFKIERGDSGIPKKMILTEETIWCLDEWLKLMLMTLEDSYEEVLDVTTEILRSLRNCVSNAENHQLIENSDILMTCNNFFTNTIEVNKNSICLKVLLQFLINLITANKADTKKVYDIFFENIKTCLSQDVHLYETSALIYNISLSIPIHDITVLNLVIEKYVNDEHHNEFLIFFLEKCVSYRCFWDNYENLTLGNKIAVLQILRHMQIKLITHNLPSTGLEILTDFFLKSMDVIFQVKQEVSKNVYEISLILEIISSLSSDPIYLQELQKQKDLFINAGVLLINVHRLGKEPENCFTPVQRLSEFTDKTVLKDHPAFGFKADLVRLIGNFCWKNVQFQNLARSCQVIPVILECCNMDAKNPCILKK